jgi:hypothetical protein
MPVKKLRPSRIAQLALGAGALAAAAVFGLGAGCSLQNQEGPDVVCADLKCGQINACEQGIIAQCVDGVHVKYRVCGSTDICGETWQVTGQFKCSQDATDCEGCRPDRTDGCAMFDTSTSSSASGSGGMGSSSSAAGG